METGADNFQTIVKADRSRWRADMHFKTAAVDTIKYLNNHIKGKSVKSRLFLFSLNVLHRLLKAGTFNPSAFDFGYWGTF